MNSSNFFELGQLAEASYANLWDAATAQPIILRDDVKLALVARNFSDAQASAFVDAWSVITHQPDTASSFSATLFQNQETGRYALAIRGTAGLLDLLEDVSNIVADGLAMDQIVDLYNFWKWVTTPAGQSYQVARLVDLAEGGDPSKVLVERFGGYSTIQFESSSTVYSAIDQYATGLGKTDIAVNGLDVTGHSLGGHLAAAFTRLFPALGAAATTINGAGFATAGPFGGVSGTAQINIENLFGMLGGVGSFGAVQNIYGDKMPEVITQDGPVLYQQGMHDELFIEQDGFFDNTLGHGSSQMTDSLAVYDLFIELDGSLQSSTPQAALAKLKPLFESGSSNASRSLETLVNALADLFDTGTRIGDAQTDNREALYLAINKIKTDADFTRTQGLLTVQPFAALSRDQLVAKAQLDGAEGLAYRYAIANLSPFAIGGDAALYSPHNAAGELDLYNPATGQGELTERYLRDRAAMLAWQNQFNANDTQPVGDTFVKLQGGTPFYFEDFTNNAITTKMRIGGGDSVNAVMSRPLGDFNLIVFGSENNDALTGQGKGDRFYGGAGADTLTGKGGNDYLEGGAGFDTYVINAGDGHDTLLDTDGQGLIEIGGVYAQGSATDELEPGQWKRLGPHAWTDTLHGITYTRIIHEGETRLLIKRGDASVLVRGWSDGQLGIELGAGAAVALPGLATSFHLEGDLQPVAPHAASGYDSYGNAFVTAEAAPDRADVLYDHETDDHLQGHGGNDLLIAQHGGHDLLEGGAGFDFLMGGTGNDQLFGETRIDDLAAYLLAAETQAGTGEVGDWLSGWDGSDILVGGAGNDVLVGGKGEDLMIAGAGNDLVYGDFEHTVTPNPDGSTTYYMPGQLATEGAADVIYGNAGDDQLHGNQGNDILDGGAHHDTLYGEAGDDVLLGGEGSDKLYGDGNGTLPEDEGNDYLDGGPGIDYLAGGGGNDTYVNVTGEDTLFDNQGHNTVFVLANEVDPAGLAASVQTNAAGQSFMQVQIALDSVGALRVDDPFAATGTTTLEFANGEALDLETLIGERLFTPLNLNLGGSGGRAYGGAGNDTLRGGMGDDTLLGYAGDDMLSGKDGADTLEGGAGGDYLSGGASDDVLDGGAGDDTLDGGAGDDTLQAGAGDDSLYGGEGADTLLGADGNDELWGDEGADILEGGAGDDYLFGGTDDDVYRLETGSGWDTIDDIEGRNRIEFAAGIDLESLSLSRGVYDYQISYGDGWDGVSVSSAWALSPNELKFADGTYVLSNEMFTGIPVPVWGDEEDNVLAGLGPGVEFWGGWGGDDTLIGGAGDNVYYFDLGDGSDAIVDLGGVDTLSFGEGITPDDLHVESGDLGNQLPGFRVYVGPDGDVISIQGGESGVLEKFQFSDGLTLTFDEMLAWQGGLHVVPGGTMGDRHGERLVVGTDGEDELDDSGVQFSSSGYGVAYLGGLGNDAIMATVRTGSLFLLNQGDGNDTIRRAEIDAEEGPDAFVFGAGITLESLSFSFVERTVTRYGGPFIGMTTYTVTDTVIQYGSAGDSVTMLEDSLADLNFMFADGRVATYSSLTSGVTVVTAGGGPGPFEIPAGDDARPAVYWDGTTGDDTYVARDMLSVNDQIAKPQRDAVDGGAGNDHIATRAGNDWLTGGQGNDLLEGGTGSDVYVFAEGDGADTIRDTTAAGEKNYLLVSGAAAPTFEYDGSDLLVHYNSGADVIRVEQFFPSGLDEHAAISGVLLDRSETGVHPLEIFYSLDDIKAAVHIQSGGPDDDTLTGSDANDFLFGNAGADTLEGGKGDDMLIGGAGDDTYVINLGDGVDTILDSFTGDENNTIVFGAGVDPGLVKLFKGSLGLDLGGGNTVHIEGVDYGDIADTSSIRNFMFADGTLLSVEQLLARGFDVVGSADDDMLSGTSVSDRIDGGAGNDNLSGLAGNDVLNGNAGDDALIGGTGDDTYIVDSAADAIIENAGEGNDTVESGITLTLAANVENLTLAGAAAINGTGNTLNNVLTGNSAANILNGGEGSDWMIGGAGNDTYVVDHVRDVIAELYDEGVDLVQSDISYILGPNVEKLTLTGVGAINGRGNTLDNVLTGNSAANILNGGEGADTMIGGAGDDTYVVDNALDVVTENPDEGIDSVESSKTFMLAPDVENLTLTGTGAINGTGNILDNVLKGNNSANKLTGAEGNDTLEGMGGNDTLTGGAGDDTYLIGRGYRTDTIVENDATAGNTDIAQFLSGIAVDQIWFKKSADNLEVSIIGTSDKFVVRDWYLDSAYRVEQFQTADDARTLLDSNVQNLVNAMASFAPPAAGQTTLPTSYQDALAGVIAANWQ